MSRTKPTEAANAPQSKYTDDELIEMAKNYPYTPWRVVFVKQYRGACRWTIVDSNGHKLDRAKKLLAVELVNKYL